MSAGEGHIEGPGTNSLNTPLQAEGDSSAAPWDFNKAYTLGTFAIGGLSFLDSQAGEILYDLNPDKSFAMCTPDFAAKVGDFQDRRDQVESMTRLERLAPARAGKLRSMLETRTPLDRQDADEFMLKLVLLVDGDPDAAAVLEAGYTDIMEDTFDKPPRQVIEELLGLTCIAEDLFNRQVAAARRHEQALLDEHKSTEPEAQSDG